MHRKRPFCISRRGVLMEQRQNRVWGSKKKRTSLSARPETVEKLRFSDNLCFDFAKHGRPKVPMRKLSPS